MKLILSWFCILIFFNVVHADELRVELNPTRPVAGEVFQVYFRIFTDSDQDPEISFSETGLEVIGKSNQGTSSRSIYANGTLTVTREVTVVYDLIAKKPGSSMLKDIKVALGGKVLKHAPVSILVLKEPIEAPDVFVMVDVPKTTLYVGEGVIVRYYMYSKVPVANVDIKAYPKLNNFLKRFMQEPDRGERVSVDGTIYLRSQIYAAKLFPEKPGDRKIDSMGITVSYATSRSGSPFGMFGGNQRMKTKAISSEAIKVQVIPLPDPVPANFTGLVGKHDFEIQFNQNKLIINQPLEVKLTVSGGGALENLEAPKILRHQGLEEFESNGDLKLSDADTATKTFDYTFLAKENFKMPQSNLSLSYFEPNDKKYVSVELEVPEIEVAGGVQAAPNIPSPSAPEKVKDESSSPKITKPKEIAAPAFLEEFNFRAWLPKFNVFLAIVSVLIALGWVIKVQGINLSTSKVFIPSDFKKGKFSLGEFTSWLTPVIQRNGKSPIAVIKESDLDQEAKGYFIALLDSNDYKDYSSEKGKLDFNYHSGHFKSLGRYIESVKNENAGKSA